MNKLLETDPMYDSRENNAGFTSAENLFLILTMSAMFLNHENDIS
jgi:hypothetical protein